MTYYLLEATQNGCIRDYFYLFIYLFIFRIGFFSLINGEAVLFYQNKPHCGIE